MNGRCVRRPGLICFDLDGTLYLDRRVYPRIILHFFQDTPYRAWIPEIQARMEEILSGKAPLRCGQFVPKQAAQAPACPEDLFRVPGVTALLERDPAPYFDRTRYTYISDGWTLAMYLARRIGWAGEAFWHRFRAAREDLVSDRYGPRPEEELISALAMLRGCGTRLVLCSNAAAEGGWELLRHLKLDESFDEVAFDADKPHSFPCRIRDWGLPPEEMLFVGDQGYYDLYAGKQAGASTVLISPYHVEDAGLWKRRVRTLPELTAYLRALCEESVPGGDSERRTL